MTKEFIELRFLFDLNRILIIIIIIIIDGK